MIKFKTKTNLKHIKDRLDILEQNIETLNNNILDSLKNLTDTQEDIIENYVYLRNKFNSHKYRIHTRYSTDSPIAY